MRDRVKRLRNKREKLDALNLKPNIKVSKNEIKCNCINCPNACKLKISLDEKGNLTEVIGNKCFKGYAFAVDVANENANK
ncbi:MAG: hypothetical protein LBM02_02260 [Lachnospiraceae bacterium]|jgi:hypothetical protein|nr:hypothetical protein [Lachnospiraceae bacterium]